MLEKNNRWHENYFLKSIGAPLCFLFLTLLSGCSTVSPSHHRYHLRHDCPPNFRINAARIPDAVPRAEPLSKRGNPKSYAVSGRRYYVLKSARGYRARGIASWYGMKFHNFLTSSGEPYDLTAMTAAHKTLPLPTYLQVRNLQNGKQVIVKVNDRGPFSRGRILDLSYVAAQKLGMIPKGTAPVEIRAIAPGCSYLAANNATVRPPAPRRFQHPVRRTRFTRAPKQKKVRYYSTAVS